MSDQYLTISNIAADQSMRQRVAGCAATQGEATPEHWAYEHAYQWAASPTWAEKWDYAVAAGNDAPGKDPAVITDADILATVQGLRSS